MTDELSPTQALALWGLLARQGRAAATEVKPKADRDALAEKALIEVRANSATVTDSGWRWASEHFDAALPLAQATLGRMLELLGAHLKARGETLAAFIGEPPPAPESAPKPATEKRPRATKAAAGPKAPKTRAEPKASSVEVEPTAVRAAARPKVPKAEVERKSRVNAPLKAKAPPKPKAGELRVLIEAAYLRASGGARSEPVRLSKLRAELGDLDRKTVDAGLARIVKDRKETASLSQISDNKAIDAAEREAAYGPAGQPFHLIRIQ